MNFANDPLAITLNVSSDKICILFCEIFSISSHPGPLFIPDEDGLASIVIRGTHNPNEAG